MPKNINMMAKKLKITVITTKLGLDLSLKTKTTVAGGFFMFRIYGLLPQ